MIDIQLDKRQFLEAAIEASLRAGEKIQEVYEGRNRDEFELKLDQSPLTVADKKANSVILKLLGQFDIPVLSEEGRHEPYEMRKDWDLCWIVDPLDGTKEFLKKNHEFTVNIALTKDGKPILGVIYVPIFKQLYFGCPEIGAYKAKHVSIKKWDLEELIGRSQKIKSTADHPSVVHILASRSHMNGLTQQFVDKFSKKNEIRFVSVGSSLKLCQVAEGRAHLYPRYAPTMEWDIAAGHAIVNAAGGHVYIYNDPTRELTYNKEDLVNPWFLCKAPGVVVE
ncbi:MAG: 3'(2'),5'-bisphosphate nucleotidase CysQ [Marinifilaceae bacterium]|jgi:3'(2'), 5'-bisphosphate nucleotidase|nr:3'(2'),5'-bisphosphate nucleotidase CysQ [Marinifilaceae bacterium]